MAQVDPKTDSKQVVVELTMSLEEARRFTWLGTRAPREPMGQLLDSKQLDLSDLAWATEVGYDPQFREAARTLLAYRIGRPTPRRYGPRVIEGSHFLEDSEREKLIEFSFLSGFAFGVFLWIIVALLQTVFTSVIPQLNNGNIATAIVILLFSMSIIILLGWFLYKQMKLSLNLYRDFQQGRKGEEEIVDRLRTALDNRWTIFRNLILPNQKDDIDIVLVGPDGVWAIEVKSTKSTLRVTGKNWTVQTKKGWFPTTSNPSNSVTKKAFQLNDYLKRQGIERFVERAIALATPQPITNFEASEIPIWLFANIEDKVANLKTRKPLTEEESNRIVKLLEDLAVKQIAIEDAKYR